MGVQDRWYMGRGNNTRQQPARQAPPLAASAATDPADLDEPPPPSFMQIADALRILVLDTIEANPVLSIQECAMLCECADHARIMHIYARAIDPQPTEEE